MFNIPEKLEITGGTPINGTVEISGAKNSVMCLMAAALLTREKVILRNVPFISDVLWFGKIMRDIGVEVFHDPYTKEMHICAERITTNVLPAETSKRIRTSYYFWGALLARFSITKELRNNFFSWSKRINGVTRLDTLTSSNLILSNCLARDDACFAFDAFAEKRRTKSCNSVICAFFLSLPASNVARA